MYNRGRYNRQYYNRLYKPPDEVTYGGLMVGVMRSGADALLVYTAEASLLGEMHGGVIGAPGIIVDALMIGETHASAMVKMNYLPGTITLTGDVGAAADATLNIGVVTEMTGTMNGLARLGTDIYYSVTLQGDVQAYLRLGKDFTASPILMSAMMHAQATTIRYDLGYIAINAEIPPGGVIVIDSNRYTVLLDGENAIDKHGGDWLLLSRRTFDVQVQPIGGTEADIDKQILYTTRWL